MVRSAVLAVALAALAGPASARGSGYHAPSMSTYHAPRSQPAYSNFGKISPSTNLPMVKPVGGYVKGNGTYVAPYARSK